MSVKLKPIGKLSAPSSDSDTGPLLVTSKTDRVSSDGDIFTDPDISSEFGNTVATEDSIFYNELS